MVLNEFGFTDLFSLIMDIGDASDAIRDASKKVSTTRYSSSSSAKAASKLIAVFPVLCSSNVSKDTATLVTKYTERRGCIQLQLVLTAMNVSNVENGFEYLSQFHQNITGGSLRYYEDMISNLNDRIDESVDFRLTVDQTKQFVKMLQEAYASGMYEDIYTDHSLNDFIVKESMDGYYTVSIDQYKFNGASLMEAKSNNGKRTVGENSATLKDSDIKKMNEAVPSLIVVRFTSKQDSGNVETEFLIGVKAKLIPCDYMEIINKIVSKNKDGRGLVNLIRATTGEIDIISDYLLAMDQQKDDVLSRSKRGSNQDLWKRLENDAIRAERAVRGKRLNRASAITTCVITSEDADYIYKNENIDIRNVNEAKKFMQAYNLMGLVICNDAEEVAWFIYDEEEPYFEKMAYTMLERETSDNQYKKIINIMSKMR